MLREGLEHLKIETRLIDERFAIAMGECVNVTLKVRRLYSYRGVFSWMSFHFFFDVCDDSIVLCNGDRDRQQSLTLCSRVF